MPDAEDIADKVAKGNYVLVSGKVNQFQGRRQLILKDIRKLADSEVNKDEFVMKAQVSPEVMFEKLEKIIADLPDFYIRSLLENALADTEIQRRLKLWQAGKTIHHAYQSGLLEHILSCAELSVALAPKYNVNVSYVVAGAILHDLCKIYELTDGAIVDYTEEGKLVGHLVKGVEIVDRFSYRIPNFPYQMKLHLKHILLSHHGEYEYGSPKIPQTKEAMLVHLIDLMDSKMASFDTIISQDTNSGHWSNYVRSMDRIIFKGELPTFTEEIVSSDKKENKSLSNKSSSKKNDPPELKQNLGNLLKDFKVK